MKVKYPVNGNEYEIKSGRTESGFEVRIYLGGRRIGPSYSVTYETAAEFGRVGEQTWEDELIGIAKGDLDRGIVTS